MENTVDGVGFPLFLGLESRKSPGISAVSFGRSLVPTGRSRCVSEGCVDVSGFPALCLPGALWCVLRVLLEREEPEECWDLFWCLVRLLSTSWGCLVLAAASWNSQCLLQTAQSSKKEQRGFSIRVFIIFWSVILHEKQFLKLLYT